MKTLEAYVMTRGQKFRNVTTDDEPFRKVKAQIYPDMPFTMIYQLAPRCWGAGDIEIGMSYNAVHYPSAAAALQDIQKSNVIERAAKVRNSFAFDIRKKEVIDHAIEENNVKLYDYLNSLKEANENG